jgi:serine/threonine protein kinase
MTKGRDSHESRSSEPLDGSGPAADPAPTERTRFLQRMLEDQERGRLQPVDRYVAEFAQIEDFVRSEHRNLSRPASSEGEDDVFSQDLRKGDRVGRYELVRVIGEGGMGRAWLARDPMLARDVVVKALRGDVDADDPGHERLRREARVLGKLDHPAIAKVLDILEDGKRAYLVLPFYDGETLASRIARARARSESAAVQTGPWVEVAAASGDRPASLRALLEFFAAAADALHTAHRSGVVHRDLKPQNLIVQADGSPVVLDFGLALPTSDDRLTQPGEVIGTPLYMSPEQVDGSRPVDVRSDVYSLGVTLYEALALVHPFTGDGGREATFHRVLRGDPVPLRRHQPLIPRDLEAVVQKAMEREPQRRYADAAAFARELRRVIALEPTEARPVSGITLWVRRATRRPRRLAAATVTLSMLCGSGWIAWDSAYVHDRMVESLEDQRRGLVERNAETLTTGLVLDWCEFAMRERGLIGDAQALLDLDALEQRGLAMQPPLGVCRALLLRGAIVEQKTDAERRDVLERYIRLLRKWPDEPRKAWVAFAAARWATHHAGDAAAGESLAGEGVALVDKWSLAGQWTQFHSLQIATDPEFWVAERRRQGAAGVEDSRGQGLLLRAEARSALGRIDLAMEDVSAAIANLEASSNVHRLANALGLRAEIYLARALGRAARDDAARAAELYDRGFTDPTPDNRDRPGAAEVRIRDRQGFDAMRKLQARAFMVDADWAQARGILSQIEVDKPAESLSHVNRDVPLLLAECLLRDPQAEGVRSREVRKQLERGRAFYEPRGMRRELARALRLEAEMLDGEGAERAATERIRRAELLEAGR